MTNSGTTDDRTAASADDRLGEDTKAPQDTDGTGRTGRTGRPATSRGPLFSWRLGLATLAVAGLLVASLLTGVYDIFGAADGAEMFQITRVPRTVALVLAGAAMAMCGLVMRALSRRTDSSSRRRRARRNGRALDSCSPSSSTPRRRSCGG